MNSFPQRLRIVGIVVGLSGLALASAGLFYGMPKATAGLASAQQLYMDQGVTLSYDDQGRFIDHGTPEGGAAVLALLEDDWQYPVDRRNLDPSDPLVNTRDELMVQYALITLHVLEQEVAVNLAADAVPITYRGVTYAEAGTYDIMVGEYYAELDRTHPIEGQLRGAWTAQALALTGALAGGHANHAAGEVAWFTSVAVGAVGLLMAAAGAGLVWATLGRPVDPVPAAAAEAASQLNRPNRAARPGREVPAADARSESSQTRAK